MLHMLQELWRRVYAQKTQVLPRKKIETAKAKGLNKLDLSQRYGTPNAGKFTEIPTEVFELDQLEHLDLSYNSLNSIPDSITKLRNLTYLDLSGNSLGIVPASITQLQNLSSLYLSYNQLGIVPISITHLSNLTHLFLNGNDLSTVPEFITRLKNLTTLDLSSNHFRSFPESIIRLPNLTHLYLSQNPIEIPPLEVINLDKDGRADLKRIRNYYRQLSEVGEDHLYEAKLLIVGEPGAGKTSLAKKIKNRKYNLRGSEKTTEGIEVIRWEFPMSDNRPFRVNIWDFGGQEIYHATHQFFLTKRSLYLLVADMRREDTDFNYWLNAVELLSDGSPVLIIKNEKQNREREIDEAYYRGLFKNLQKTLPTNLATNAGLDEIEDAIKYYISHLPHIGSPLPKTWVRVREALDSDPRDYIGQEEYLRICAENGFRERKDSLQLSGYLHDIGVCLHFQDDSVLKSTVILKPKWGTDAVYKVLDNKMVTSKFGRFDKAALAAIWNEAQYADMHHELLQLMINFKLCYQIPHTEDYIAPQLLTGIKPQYEWEASDNLVLRYSYGFMPKGILTQFIVALHGLIAKQEWVWKNGVILERSQTRGEVVERYDNKEIRIRVAGKHKKELLTTVMDALEGIHRSYNRLKYNMLIPCNCHACRDHAESEFYPFDLLQQYEGDGRRTIECRKGYRQVDVWGLINEVLDPKKYAPEEGDMRDHHKREGFMGNQYINYGQVAAFGDNAHAENFTQQMQAVDLNNLNFPALAAELKRVREAEMEEATEPEHFRAIADVKAAENAAAKSDKPAVFSSLKSAGKWMLDVAVKVSAAAAAKVIEHQLIGG